MGDFDILYLLHLLREYPDAGEAIVNVVATSMYPSNEFSPSLPEHLIDAHLFDRGQVLVQLEKVHADLREAQWDSRRLIADSMDSLDPSHRQLLWEKLPFLAWCTDPSLHFQLSEPTPFAIGGLGLLWKAVEHPTGRTVLVKQIRPEMLGEPSSVQRFVDEGCVAARLEHPNIVPIYRVPTQKDGYPPYYVMRWIQGRTLGSEIMTLRSEKVTDEQWLDGVRTLTQHLVRVCDAVMYAHSQGILHRDLKPENIMIGDFGETHLLDWGLVKRLDTASSLTESTTPGSDQRSYHTVQGSRIGSPAWMSPEQASGVGDIDERTDIFGLGGTLFSILTGRPPNATDSKATIRQVIGTAINAPTPRPSAFEKRTPQGLEAICVAAMQKKRSDRYQQVDQLISDLNAWLDGDPISVYREPIARRLARYSTLHPTFSALVSGSFLTLFVTLLLLAIFIVSLGNTISRVTMSFVVSRRVSQSNMVRDRMNDFSKQVAFLMELDDIKEVFFEAKPGESHASDLSSIRRFVEAQPACRELNLVVNDAGKGFQSLWRFRRIGDHVAVSESLPLASRPDWVYEARSLRARADPQPILFHHRQTDEKTGARVANVKVLALVRTADRFIGYLVVDVDLSKLLNFDTRPFGTVGVTTLDGDVIFWQQPSPINPDAPDKLLKLMPNAFDDLRTTGEFDCQTLRLPNSSALWQWQVCGHLVDYTFSNEKGRLCIIDIIDWKLFSESSHFLNSAFISVAAVTASTILLSLLLSRLLKSLIA
ncbi:Serine/threonine-protein kinase PknD [Planctomycetes bacterium Pan216]|uniref:Serine/threonine-protein kinase PknD n=1 Tax=Kolteria novifilia TaxID=2527975 RepID=A0A518AZF3_9BACT|nr:Serine/threonine-protein kinase PknD [Planctomycetes bacterium Pan216]